MSPEENNTQNQTRFQAKASVGGWISWVVLLALVGTAVFAWGDSLSWDTSSINLYVFFPLLGLLAWSIMWSHYFLAFSSSFNDRFKMSKLYKKLTGYLVLVLILFHPGLLAFAQWQNLSELPPGSYLSYVGDSMILAIIAAEIALVTFLSFEILNRLKNHPAVKRHWLWVSLSQMFAITLIFGHSLALGSNLQSGWFKYYWIMLGLILIPCFFVVGRMDIKHSRENPIQ